MFALIRSHFGINAENLDDETFAQLSAEAVWLTNYQRDMMELAVMKAVVNILGSRPA